MYDSNIAGSTRKRARSPTPGSAGRRATSPRPGNSGTSSGATAAQQKQRQELYARQRQFAERLRSSDLAERNDALNELLRITSTHEHNFGLLSEEILLELVRIFKFDCLIECEEEEEDRGASKDGIENGEKDQGEEEEEELRFSSKEAWLRPPTRRQREWAERCKTALGHTKPKGDKLRTMEVILVILRNMSFVGANLRLLAYSSAVMEILVGCLYEVSGVDYVTSEDLASSSASSSSSSIVNASSLAFSAINTLLHIVPHLDISGQRVLADRLFYKPPQPDGSDGNDGSCPAVPEAEKFGFACSGSWGFGGLWLAKRLDAKEDVVADVTKDFLLEHTSDYLVSVWSIFPALEYVLTNPKSPRPVILMALDLLQELINQARGGANTFLDNPLVESDSDEEEDKDEELPTMREVLAHVPDSMLDRLVDLLYVPRLGPDSLDYTDPVHNIVTRVTALKLMMGYDATVDTDARDRALDVLVPLLELDSPRMAKRLGRMHPNGNPRLFEAVVPCLTTNAGRNEAPSQANQLMRELSMAKENQIGFEYVRDRLAELASRDARVSQLVWNHLYTEGSDDEGSGSDRGSGDDGSVGEVDDSGDDDEDEEESADDEDD